MRLDPQNDDEQRLLKIVNLFCLAGMAFIGALCAIIKN